MARHNEKNLLGFSWGFSWEVHHPYRQVKDSQRQQQRPPPCLPALDERAQPEEAS